MPDNLDELLTDLAREAGGSVRVPPAGTVRRRGARRGARRCLTASVLAVVLAGAAVGTAEAMIVPHGGPRAPVVGGTPSAGRRSALPSPGVPSVSASGVPHPSSSAPTGGPPASVGTEPSFSALVGQWKPADGMGRYLVIYPDGVLGIGQAGGQGQPLCAGRVLTPSNGTYPISVACSDYGTSGLSLSVDAGQLMLHVAATSGHPAWHVAWVRAQTWSTSQVNRTATLPPWLVATWVMGGNPTYETFTVAADGTVTWSLEDQQGRVTHGTATIEPLPDGTFRVHTATGTPAFNGIWQFAHLVDGQLQVIGGYGPNAFDLSVVSR
jgi:hypothetical protein